MLKIKIFSTYNPVKIPSAENQFQTHLKLKENVQLLRHPVCRMTHKSDSFRHVCYDGTTRWQCFVTFRLDNASRMSERFIRCIGSVTHVRATSVTI